MQRYIALVNFTEQGIKSIADWDKRLANARTMLAASEGKLIDAYLTFGPYDAVIITEAKDDEAALRGALRYGLGGNGRSITMRAFGESEAVRVTKSLG
jgi:uncharacterized protein with GYD domain